MNFNEIIEMAKQSMNGARKGQLFFQAIPSWGILLIGVFAAFFLVTLFSGAAGLAGEAFRNATLAASGGNVTSAGYILVLSGLAGMTTAAAQNSTIATMAAIGVLLAAVFGIFGVIGGGSAPSGGRRRR